MKASTIPHHRPHFLHGGAAATFTLLPKPHLRPPAAAAFFPIRMSLRDDAPSLAVVGVTGAVGQEFLSVLSDRSFPYRSIKMLASKRSAGKHLTFEGNDYVVEELTPESFNGVDIALFSAGGSISKKFGPIAVDCGSIVVDNSSAFRMDENVPLVIPEVNPEAMAHIKLGNGKGALIANPNCSTIICLMAATPLHRHAKVLRMVVSTYQAASGAGAAAMEELEQQTREVLEGKPPTCNIFNQQYAFNLFSHNAPILSNGYNEEEMKLVKETRKIWNDMNVKVTATCIRVPVMRAHAESVNLQFENPLDEDTARDILKNAPGVVVIDDRAANRFPTPLEVSNKDDVAVGRIRRDVSQDVNYGVDIFVCGDQIRKGAALNAVQIAEMLLDTARDILKNAPGVVGIDDRAANRFPTPLEVSNKDHVAVGRIGRDVSQDGNYGKGAALNAVQIAEMLLESVEWEHKSKILGKMHGYGHDAHAAMLLGGMMILVFQPAEEGGRGAKIMLEVGILENVDAIFGLHVSSRFPIGTVAGRSGPILAGSGFFKVVISGKGGHAAISQHPIDPILAASNVIVSLQHLVSREADPLNSQSSDSGKIPRRWCIQFITGQVVVHRCNATVNFDDKPLYLSTISNKELHRYFGNVARDMLGEKNVLEMQPLMGAEDFSFFAEAVLGYFYMVGMQNETQGQPGPAHSLYFTINEDVHPYGAALHASLATRYLIEYQQPKFVSSKGSFRDEFVEQEVTEQANYESPAITTILSLM
ncbi:unnamed protein product [Camellia sinensis]